MNIGQFLKNLAWASFFAYTAFLSYAMIGWFMMWPMVHPAYVERIFLIPQKDMNMMSVVLWSLYALNMIVLDDLGYKYPKLSLFFFAFVIGMTTLNIYTDSSWLNVILTVAVGLLFASWIGQLMNRGPSIDRMIESLSEV